MVGFAIFFFGYLTRLSGQQTWVEPIDLSDYLMELGCEVANLLQMRSDLCANIPASLGEIVGVFSERGE